MGLTWFAFDMDAYTGDTSHLTTEEHGAYLLLMLAYYRSEKPLPATDRALSAITKLPMDRWLECKPAMSGFFVEVDGIWRHDRIEAELAESHKRMAKFAARGKAGGAAKQQNRLLAASSSQQDDQKKHTLTLTIDSLSTDQNLIEKEVPSQSEPDPTEAWQQLPAPDLRPIEALYRPAAALIDECLTYTDASTVELELQKFVYHHQGKGSLSEDWDASFRLWMERFKDFKAKAERKKAPKPRVEVNSSPDPETKENWDWRMQQWLKSESLWPFRTAGPEPGMSGCRVPPEMFEKYGIDPKTGMKKAPVST